MTAGAKGVLNNLVTQFATPYDCIRELVQNSIDAGTSQVHVWVDYETGEGGGGIVAIHVDDFGEGMNEEIIDQQFTKLFASDKEGDLTKIGKFGIGFVSVFALDPEAVLVHTGRGGEYWEVLFHKDRSFSKTNLDVPVEGTQITIFLNGSPALAEEAAREVRASLKKWCVYAETELMFEDRTGATVQREIINETFGVEGEFSIIKRFDDSSIIAVAYNRSPIYGFYNRGLTLALSKVSEQVLPQHLVWEARNKSVKIKSRYLEHTLSRDSVVRDGNFTSVMHRLKNVFEVDVPNRLFVELQKIARVEKPTVDDLNRYALCLSYFGDIPKQSLQQYSHEPLFIGFEGKRYSADDLFQNFRSSGFIFAASEPSQVVQKCISENIPVLRGGPDVGPGVVRFLEAASTRTIWGLLRVLFFSQYSFELTHPDRVIREIAKREPGPVLNQLLEDTVSVLSEFLPWLERLEPAVVVPRKLGENAIFFEKGGDGLGFILTQVTLDTPSRYVNVEHPHLVDLTKLYVSDRSLAVYCLARAYMLQKESWVGTHYALIESVHKKFGAAL